jgi:tetratricopeptide (TPR) repeat protein
MKKIALFFLIIIFTGVCHAQIRMEYYYPEKFYTSNYEEATNPARKIDIGGEMAIYYSFYCKDSLRDLCINRNYTIANKSQDPALIVRARFWDAYAHSQSITFDETEYTITAANDLLQYAEKYHFLEYKIAAYNILSGVFQMNNNLKNAEKYAVSASLFLEDLHDDSLKIEVYGTMAHVFIFEKDGMNASRYLLKLYEYAENEDNEAIRLQAMYYLGWLYFDMGEYQKAISYNKKIYQIFAKRKDIYGQTGIIGELMFSYSGTDDKMLLKYYCETLQQMQDSLDIVNFQTYSNALFQWSDKMITSDQYVQKLKSNFGNRYFWPKAKVYCDLAIVYMVDRNIDSAECYLNKAKLCGVEKLIENYAPYDDIQGKVLYLKKEYEEASKVFSKIKTQAKEKGNIQNYMNALLWLQWCYEQMNYNKKAMPLMREYFNLNDSIEKLNNKQEMTIMEVEKDKEINDHKLKEKEAKLEHRHNIQYMGMALGALAIILVLILLGLVKARPWVIRSMSFFSFIFIFEFIILILDNRIHELTAGEPWKIMMIKVVVIGLLLPFHHFVEKQVAHNLIHKNLSPAKWIKTIWGDRIHKPEE